MPGKLKWWAVVFSLIILIYTDLSAQSKSRGFFQNETKTFYGGFLLGANISTVDGDTYAGYHKVGLNTGATVFATFRPWLLGSVEILYTQKGSRGVNPGNNTSLGPYFEKYYLDLNYVEVAPVLHFVYSSQLTLGVGAGYSRLLRSKEDAYTLQPITVITDTNVFRKEDYSLVLDGVFQIGDGLFFGGRYESSLRTIRDWNRIPIGYGYGGQQFNRLFSFRLMYLIK